MKVEMNGNNNINIGDPPSIKKPVYGVSGYTTNLAVKMTALVNPNHKVIGQQVYDALDDGQKSMYQHLNISSEVWNYVSSMYWREYIQSLYRYPENPFSYRS